jgi:hypothetical protein
MAGEVEMDYSADKDVSQKYCYRFGKIAVQKGFITEEQLKDAIIDQLEDNLNDRPHRLIGKILIDKDMMTMVQVNEVLNELFARENEE